MTFDYINYIKGIIKPNYFIPLNYSNNYGFDSIGRESFDSTLLNETNELNKTIAIANEEIEGNIFYTRKQTCIDIKPEPYFVLQTRRRNISRVAPYINSVLEIGLNGGHSALFWLTLNKNIKYYGVDICEHKYTTLAADFLKKKFKDRFTFFKGDSTVILPGLVNHIKDNVDLIVIDGGHSSEIASQDFTNSFMISKDLGSKFILVDDSDEMPIHKLILKIIFSGKVSSETLSNTWESEKQILLRIN